MPKYRIDVAGSNQLQRRLAALPDDLRDSLKGSLRDAAKSVRSEAQDEVPVESGDLRKSIKFRVDGRKLTATVRVEKFYGHFVEFGTTSQEAQPFMRPAFEAERRRFAGRISDDVRKALS
ncbi:HK97-gp10 family putative phage morphogenesis protein [Salininema proteolyticum]|uniref:HK97-gp10 family putative phage morphogenesis protein n=1 Tax=Salininema proteolyticum TaxID=1607685 RepID=A0ABV8TSY5_9ACTN